jgi:hypothetical protein
VTTQTDVLEELLTEEGSEDSTIHVMAPPEGPLCLGYALCTPDTACVWNDRDDVSVVFHADAFPQLSGAWLCPACGQSTDGTEEE